MSTTESDLSDWSVVKSLEDGGRRKDVFVELTSRPADRTVYMAQMTKVGGFDGRRSFQHRNRSRQWRRRRATMAGGAAASWRRIRVRKMSKQRSSNLYERLRIRAMLEHLCSPSECVWHSSTALSRPITTTAPRIIIFQPRMYKKPQPDTAFLYGSYIMTNDRHSQYRFLTLDVRPICLVQRVRKKAKPDSQENFLCSPSLVHVHRP